MKSPHLRQAQRRSALVHSYASRRLSGRIRTLAVALTLSALIAGASAGSAVAVPTATGAKQVLGKSLAGLVKAGAPGVALFVRQGERTASLARGFADTARKTPMRGGDTFRIGSLTKSYVATVVLQLEEEGKLSLDDPVAKFVPGLVPGGEAITVRELLNHTSGLFDYEDDPRVLKPYLGGDLDYYWSPRALVKIAVSHRPLFAPGTEYHYSNTNYLVAGLIVESITGSTMGQQLKQRIFKPLGLRHTAFPLSSHEAVPTAHGYFVFDRPPATDITGLRPYPWAAGAIVADSGEVARYYSALLSGDLLTGASLAAIKDTVNQGTSADFAGSGYGLGIESISTSCGTAWGNGGNYPGYLVYALTSANGQRQAVLTINEDPASLPPKLGAAYFRVLEEAFCGAAGGR